MFGGYLFQRMEHLPYSSAKTGVGGSLSLNMEE